MKLGVCETSIHRVYIKKHTHTHTHTHKRGGRGGGGVSAQVNSS